VLDASKSVTVVSSLLNDEDARESFVKCRQNAEYADMREQFSLIAKAIFSMFRLKLLVKTS
jgi:cobalamin-dependent methionine synthase I